MKRNQLTCTNKGTRKTAIHKTVPFPPIPNLPLIRNIKEAFDYIFIQHKSKTYLEKEVQHWKEMYEISISTRQTMECTMKLKDEYIERLKMGDIPTESYVEIKNSIEEQKANNKNQQKEITYLKEELKKSRKFHYKDFILN